MQEENKRVYESKRKSAIQYKMGDAVAIIRTQFGSGLKIHPQYLGPYHIVGVKGNERYEVERIGSHEGPEATSCSVDGMKPHVDLDGYTDTSDCGSNHSSEGEDVGNRILIPKCRERRGRMTP